MLAVSLHISLIEPLDGEDCGSNSTLGYYGLTIWIILSIYLFVGLYVLCEEYFVPSLVILGNKLGLSEDVCGATLMAAGSSSPELFTALIGVFLLPDENPGPATNCASAAFNQGVIIGLSILFCGHKTLHLEGYPFIRDSLFYALSTFELYLYYELISPGIITFFESFLLVFTWTIYVTILYYNDISIKYVIRLCKFLNIKPPSSLVYNQCKNDCSGISPYPVELSRLEDEEDEYNNKVLMLPSQYEINNEYESDESQNDYESIKDKPTNITQKAEISDFEDSESNSDNNNNTSKKIIENKSHEKTIKAIKQALNKKSNRINRHNIPVISKQPPTNRGVSVVNSGVIVSRSMNNNSSNTNSNNNNNNNNSNNDSESLIVHILLIPFRTAFSFTIPNINGGYVDSISNTTTNKNTLHESVTNCRLVSIFIASIVWMAFLSFLTVDLANKIGKCCKLTPDVMGLTLLAIGSSLPDCFSSILVAKQGKGNMAVSNALGSNVFDICICVGLSFFLKSIIGGFGHIKVESGEGFEFFLAALVVLLLILCFLMYKSGLILRRFHGYILVSSYLVFIIIFSVVLDETTRKGSK